MRWGRAAGCAAGALLLPSMLLAKVPADEAKRLGADLTPWGAEAAANAAGSIPEWRGGLTTAPPCFKGAGSRYCDPFPDEQPLYTVSAANLAEHRMYLSPGQQALLERYPDSYRMRVFPTRRSFANPAALYEAARRNAETAVLGEGETLLDARLGVPFPIPGDGREILFNHRLRYLGGAYRRVFAQFAVTAGGDISLTRVREDYRAPYSLAAPTAKEAGVVMRQTLHQVLQPPRLAGSLLLQHEMQQPLREAHRAWQYSPGQERLRRTATLAYDTPGLGADNLRFNDQLDGFSGPGDRYDWKLVGKAEHLVPANSYVLHSDRYRYAEIVRRHHLNPDLPRYELRRVWVVEAQLRKSSSHPYRKRRLYVDEDGWQIRVVDLYDGSDQLWRVQEVHSLPAYDQLFELPVGETVYDLPSGRYLAQGLNNEDPETLVQALEPGQFEPGTVSRLAK